MCSEKQAFNVGFPKETCVSNTRKQCETCIGTLINALFMNLTRVEIRGRVKNVRKMS